MSKELVSDLFDPDHAKTTLMIWVYKLKLIHTRSACKVLISESLKDCLQKNQLSKNGFFSNNLFPERMKPGMNQIGS